VTSIDLPPISDVSAPIAHRSLARHPELLITILEKSIANIDIGTDTS